jgi:hypothetical protein
MKQHRVIRGDRERHSDPELERQLDAAAVGEGCDIVQQGVANVPIVVLTRDKPR